MDGTLVLIATPIGNPDDFSPRAAAMLAASDLVLCEDTRVTGRLLAALGLSKPCLSYHDHNEVRRIEPVLERLREGETIALVSDAGMPAVSDPGQRLVAAVAAQGFRVSVIPGPSASLAALAVSGLDTARFYFEGFLAPKGTDRETRIAYLKHFPDTFILYEAPHRLEKTLADLEAAGLGPRKLAICRELTKRYEEVLYLTVAEAISHYRDTAIRGEFVLVVEGEAEYLRRSPEKRQADKVRQTEDARQFMRDRLAADENKSDVRREAAARFGLSRNEAYRITVELEADSDMLE